MVDYDGENRYYGEGIREKLFAKPYRNWLTFDHEFYCIIFNRLKETIVLDKCTTLMWYHLDPWTTLLTSPQIFLEALGLVVHKKSFYFWAGNKPSKSEFVRYKCDKYIEVSKAQYGNFAVDGKKKPQEENDTENRRGGEPLVVATFSNSSDASCK